MVVYRLYFNQLNSTALICTSISFLSVFDGLLPFYAYSLLSAFLSLGAPLCHAAPKLSFSYSLSSSFFFQLQPSISHPLHSFHFVFFLFFNFFHFFLFFQNGFFACQLNYSLKHPPASSILQKHPFWHSPVDFLPLRLSLDFRSFSSVARLIHFNSSTNESPYSLKSNPSSILSRILVQKWQVEKSSLLSVARCFPLYFK